MNKIEAIRTKINESPDVNVYKLLINALGAWSEKYPMTGFGSLFDLAVEKGKSILPTDKTALAILKHVLSHGSFALVVDNLMNMRFSELPVELQPMAKINGKTETAQWKVGDITSDRVKALVNFGGGKSSGWVDCEGKKASLVDNNTAETAKK